jgi:hypothetical protein
MLGVLLYYSGVGCAGNTVGKVAKIRDEGFSSLLFSGCGCRVPTGYQKGKRLKPFCISGL